MTARTGDHTSATLFDEEPSTESDATPAGLAEHPRSCWFLTNRMNLNGILSSRLIAPLDSFTKYYQDLLGLTPGWVPVLNTPPGEALVRYVTERTRTGAAMLELATPPDTDSPETPLMLGGPIPFSRVAAIHLPDENSRREHTARHYGNIHPHEHLIKVTPELFTGDGPTVDAVQSAAASAPAAETVDWQAFDRLRGAISAAVPAIASEKTLRTAAACLPDGPAEDWINLGLLRGQDLVEEHTSAEMIVFRAAYDELAATDTTQAWDAVRVLQQVSTRCSRANLSQDTARELENNLETIRSVITDKREFTPFRAGSRGLTSAKALLLVLLRPELTELMQWPAGQTGANDATRQTAAVLAGALRGLSRQDVSNRHITVDDLTAAWACSLTGHAGSALPNVKVPEHGEHIELRIADEVIARAPGIRADPAAFFAALGNEERHRLAPALADAINASETRRTVITASTATITSQPDGGLRLELPGDIRTEVTYDDNALRTRMDAADEEHKQVLADILRSAETHTED